MSSDRSRGPDGLRDAYTGVVTQQGRVTLDRDFNAEHGYLSGRIEVEARDVIGPCGTPDDGFAISLPGGSPPGPPLWSPPAPLSPPVDRRGDFLISPGTMYVGGQRAAFEARPAGHPITYSYFDQPDWIPPHAPRFIPEILRRLPPELVYLDLLEQEVGAVEDPDLLEVALGGPDTTQRLRLLRRVEREAVTGLACSAAWAEAVALWKARDGLIFDPASMRLVPQARLQVSFSNTGPKPNPCDPVAHGGYLGADNQTIRVQISRAASSGSPSAQASLLWGYDNASFTYRAAPVAANPAMLTIAPAPPDAFHIPQGGQVVEILRTAAVLGSAPDATDPSGQRSIVRCVAQPTGVVRRLAQTYGPANPGDPASYIVLDSPLPAEYLQDATPLFLRVWQSEIAFAAGETVLLTDDVTGASTGVEVTVTAPAGAELTAGAFWLLAVRPSTPQAVYPERLLVAPQPPDGPRRWACPLAVINWVQHTVTDCRNPFDNLVDLSKRGSGCCSVAVSPGGALGLQDAVDRAARLGSGASVCLAPGTYTLPAPLRLSKAHSGILIECCGGNAVLQPASTETELFADGLIVLAAASGVTLRGLTLEPGPALLPAVALAGLRDLLRGFVTPAQIQRIASTMRAMIGIRAANSPALRLEDCTVELLARREAVFEDIFGVGLFLQGACTGLDVRDCRFVSQIQPSFNRLTQNQAVAPTARVEAAISSPPAPIDFRARTLTLAQTSFASIAGSLAAVDAVVARNVLVSTAGCLAVDSVNFANGAGATCDLGVAALHDCTFSALTMAFYGIAAADTLRLRDNDVRACIGGFWLQLEGWQFPSDGVAKRLLDVVWPAAQQFAERLVLDAIGLTYPLPSGADTGPQTVPSGPTSFFISGNQTEPVAFADGNGTSALLILANRPTGTTSADTSVSMLVAGNRLRSRSGPDLPTVLLLVPEQQRCAITGNLVLTESGQTNDPGPSLWLVPDVVGKGSELLAVTGNVIQGRSDLGQLSRTVTPPQSWLLYNAVPS